MGPFNDGTQIIQSIKFISKLTNGSWDQLSNGQLPFYDIYIDFAAQQNDPYVFFISPAEGSFVNGSIQLITTGSANRVEYCAGGEIIAESNTGPPVIGSWTPNQNLFDNNFICDSIW